MVTVMVMEMGEETVFKMVVVEEVFKGDVEDIVAMVHRVHRFDVQLAQKQMLYSVTIAEYVMQSTTRNRTVPIRMTPTSG